MAHDPDGTTSNSDGPTAYGFYDYCLNGNANNAADRSLVLEAEHLAPGTILKVRGARAWLLKVAEWAVQEQKTTCVIEGEAWLPGSERPLHERLRDINPGIRVIYTQLDEMAAVHLDQLADGTPGVYSVHDEERRPGTMLPMLRRRGMLGDAERACLIFPMCLHFCPASTCRECIAANARLLPPGSVIAASVGMPEDTEQARQFLRAYPDRLHGHTPADLESWMTGAGLDMAGPGVTDAWAWRPGFRQPVFAKEAVGRVAVAVGVVRLQVRNGPERDLGRTCPPPCGEVIKAFLIAGAHCFYHVSRPLQAHHRIAEPAGGLKQLAAHFASLSFDARPRLHYGARSLLA